MIDAKELRVGNWVYNDENNPVPIVVIEDELFAEWNGSDSNVMFIEAGSYRYSSINPIPLTPEILEKAGFEYFEYRSKWQKSGCYYQVHEFEDGFALQFGSTLPIPVIKYLHQLQNLFFCLCGKELDIKL